MDTCSTLELKNNILQLIDTANKTHEPIRLKGSINNAVLLAEKDYESLVHEVELSKNPYYNAERDKNGWPKGIFEFNAEDLEQFPTVEEIRKHYK